MNALKHTFDFSKILQNVFQLLEKTKTPKNVILSWRILRGVRIP